MNHSGCSAKIMLQTQNWTDTVVFILLVNTEPHSSDDIGQEWSGHHTEIQIRTRLQHMWAMASETATMFLNERIKFGGGDEGYSSPVRLNGI